MKHLLFSFSLLFISLFSLAQTNPGNQLQEPNYYQDGLNNEALREAGAALRKYTRQYYIGTGIMIGGYTLITLSAVTAASTNGTAGYENAGLATVGFLATVGGTVLQIISHRHIGKAGRLLERASMSSLHIQPSSTGIGLGLAYRF